MYVIMLTGESNTGKTTTLNKVCDTLCSKEKGWKVVHKKITDNEWKINENKEEVDYASVLAKDGKRIAIYTGGDYAILVIGALYIYGCLDIDILILACNNDRIDKQYESKYVGSPRSILQDIFANSHCLISKRGKAESGIEDDTQICDEILRVITMNIK